MTLLQLEQRYGTTADAKEFIDELIKGPYLVVFVYPLCMILHNVFVFQLFFFGGGMIPAAMAYLN